MNGYWNNLRPFEKRVVVGFSALFFVVLNFLFVIPHFSDLTSVHERMANAQRKLARYQAEIAQTNSYVAGLREFEREWRTLAVRTSVTGEACAKTSGNFAATAASHRAT